MTRRAVPVEPVEWQWTLGGGRLNAVDTTGTHPLAGTSWQLVRFQGSDGLVLTPDDRSKYTITFGADARVSARIDCNRGSGTWTSAGPSQLQFGPLALTRAMCPPGSLHDRIVKDWGYVRSYVLKNGHLFLSLMADGGIYELRAAPGGWEWRSHVGKTHLTGESPPWHRSVTPLTSEVALNPHRTAACRSLLP